MAACFLLLISATSIFSMSMDRPSIDLQALPDVTASSIENSVSTVTEPWHSIMEGATDSIMNFTNDFDLNSEIFRAVKENDFETLTNITLPADKIEGRQLPSYLRQQALRNSCRQYCFDRRGQLYCCQNRRPSLNLKRGACPRIRDYCPQSFGRNNVPVRCFEDTYCPGPDKCCYDKCVGAHVCKTPIVKVMDANQNDNFNQNDSPNVIPIQYSSSNQFDNQPISPNVLINQYGSPKQFANEFVSPNVILNRYDNSNQFANQLVSPNQFSNKLVSPNVIPNQYDNSNQFANQLVSPNVIPNQYDNSKQFANQLVSPNQFGNQIVSPNVIPNQYGSSNQFTNQYDSSNVLSNHYGSLNPYRNLFNVPNSYSNQYPVPTQHSNQYGRPKVYLNQFNAPNVYPVLFNGAIQPLH